MHKEIDVMIDEIDDKAFMVFNFEEPIKIDLTSDDQENIKMMFYNILREFINDQEIIFKFNKEKEDLYSEVAEKYIKHLNTELKSLKENFNNPNENEYNN